MAASTGSVTLSTWTNQEIAIAAYRGLLLNRRWESWVGWYNSPLYTILVTSVPCAGYAVWITCKLSQSLFTTFNAIEHTLSPARITPIDAPNVKGHCYYTALAFVALNGAKAFSDYWSVPVDSLPKEPVKEGIMGQLLVVVWKTTPYLMIIANIAMTVIQVQSGNASALVTVAFASITFIDLTVKKSANYLWYRDVVLESSVAIAALYYSNSTNRSTIIYFSAPRIIIGVVLTSQTVYKFMKKPLVDTMRFLHRLAKYSITSLPYISNVKKQKMLIEVNNVLSNVNLELYKSVEGSSLHEMLGRVITAVIEARKPKTF